VFHLGRTWPGNAYQCPCGSLVEHSPCFVVGANRWRVSVPLREEEPLDVVRCSACSLLFKTRNGTPYLHNSLEARGLTPRLKAMGLDEPGMCWHALKRFRKTWLRGKRCQEDINNFWLAHKPKTMSELYSHLYEELELRLAEAEQVGTGFDVPAPSCSKVSTQSEVAIAA